MKTFFLLLAISGLASTDAHAVDRNKIFEIDANFNYSCTHCWKEVFPSDSNWNTIHRITSESCLSYSRAIKDFAKMTDKKCKLGVEVTSCMQFYSDPTSVKQINKDARILCKKQLGSKMAADANTCLVTKWKIVDAKQANRTRESIREVTDRSMVPGK